MKLTRIALVGLTLALSSAWSASRFDRWAAILEEAPLAERFHSRDRVLSLAASENRRTIETRQAQVAATLQSRRLKIIGSTQILLNAVYFTGTKEEAEAVRDLPGVVDVVRMRAYYRLADDQATQLVNAPRAWQTLGGVGSAGNGRRIGILDSGIDHTHPAFQDSSLTPPSGFPRANRDSDLAFTNSKVIVARSYVDQLVLGNDPTISRPDDVSARDRVGHGTAAAMLAAGVRVDGPAATVSGVAPKAFLGNYKVFGSPGVNDVTFTNVIIRALEDAVIDGMDVVTLSLGRPADFGPLEACGQNRDRPCDPQANAIHNAARLNLVVVVAAGNSGNDGFNLPTLGSIESPGTAPAALTVGAFTNAHIYYQSLRVPNGPSQLSRVNVRFGDGPLPASPLTAPMRDVRSTGDNGRACRPLGNNSMTGAIAIVERGDCSLEVKINNAQRAGAIGVVILQFEGTNSVFPLRGLTATGIPAVLIGRSDGDALRSFVAANPNREGTLDPAVIQTSATANEIAIFSSQGPSIGEFGIKPELTAPGTDIYAATQNYDPNGRLYSADRYQAIQGTSFAVPIVAGAAALVKQRNPSWTPLQIKSALVNSANPDVTDFDGNNRPFRARVTGTGVGKLDAAAALEVRITADPATLSFGPITSNPVAETRDLRITNTTSAPLTINIQVQARDDASARVTVDQGSAISLSPGTTQLTVRLAGPRPNPGSYEGVIVLTTGGVSLRVPYLFAVGDGVPYNIYPLAGNGFVSFPGAQFDINNSPLLVKILDRYGVPVANTAVRWSVETGGGRIVVASERTDRLGIADAGVQMGPELGDQIFRVEAAGLNARLSGRTILLPTIRSSGVVDAASGATNQGLAPGSYISIFGSGLSELTRVFSTPYLPVALSNVSVSFDAPERGISAPGRLHFVSEGQINVQVPWEFQGLTSVRMKVSIADLSSAVFNLRLNEFSPGIFEYEDAGSGRRLAAALDSQFRVVSGANPIARGQVLQLFVNGLGRVTNTPPSGEPAKADPLSTTATIPEVRIGGRAAAVQFSGLAPGNVGLYQVNVLVPGDVPSGIQPLEISAGGVTSQTSQVAIQ